MADRILGDIERAATRGETLKLTGRELRVLRLMASGRTVEESARRLRVSSETVKTQQERVRRKLGARNGPNAVAIAFRLGILS